VFIAAMLRLIYISLAIFIVQWCTPLNVSAQATQELAAVRIDDLNDEQVRRFMFEAQRLGLGDAQIEAELLSRGMSSTEVARLRERMLALRKAASTPPPRPAERARLGGERITDSLARVNSNPVYDPNALIATLRPAYFGYEIFNNPRLSFEPNLRIPTPATYLLAAGDELLINVSGLSEASYQLVVSPEGVIRIPAAGAVAVSGLTVTDARRAIRKKLASTIYTAINTGRTTVDVSLGTIRSIRVTVIGEAVLPGTFTLPSLATVFHALFASGGPNTSGTLRDIRVIRNNKTIAEIDVYEFLASGNKSKDIPLRDYDVIRIGNYDKRIELKGEVKRPGYYDVKPGESLSTIISYAGGFTDAAYAEKAQLYRNTAREKKISTIAAADFPRTMPERGDQYIFSRILNRFANRINIKGAVYRPGDYELKPGMTLLKLVAEADGIREDAFVKRGSIHRLQKDLSPQIIPFELDKILSGDSSDIPLQAEDRVTIFSRFDLKEGYYVVIDGEVTAPGYYLFEDGMQVQDLVLMAGGLKESSSMKRVEVSRRIKDADVGMPGSKTALIYQKELTGYSPAPGDSLFYLMPFDEVTVRISPGYSPQKNVFVEGEVLYTGKYTLDAKTNRISDLIGRAGGLTPDAYLQGAVLVRSRVLTATEQTNAAQGLQNLIKQNLLAGTPAAILQNQLTTAISQRSQFVGIDLKRIIEKPGSKYDLILNEGDTLRVPKQLQTVRVNGEVLFPTIVRYDKSLRFKDYIINAGGFSERSLKRRAYTVRANGSVEGTRSFLFFQNYPSVKPGDELYIPLKRERERLRTGEVITIGATLVSMLAILVTVIK
jgi:protein involved in polysaccharide export with SLBB domain